LEPPAGNFVVIARCKLSGALLGPPNYHGYNAKLQDIWKKRFGHMSLDEYRSHIETVRDPELIEKWKQENSTQVAYKPRAPEGAPALTLAEVQKIFMQDHAPTLVAEGHRFIVPAEAAGRIEDSRLRGAVREAWTRESHRPFSLMLALRPAFNHMGLNLFRVQSGVTFATYSARGRWIPARRSRTSRKSCSFCRLSRAAAGRSWSRSSGRAWRWTLRRSPK